MGSKIKKALKIAVNPVNAAVEAVTSKALGSSSSDSASTTVVDTAASLLEDPDRDDTTTVTADEVLLGSDADLEEAESDTTEANAATGKRKLRRSRAASGLTGLNV